MATIVRGAQSRRPNGWLAVGGVFTALAIAAGGLSTAGWLGFRSETQDHTYHQAVTRISIDVGTGDLKLSPGGAGEVAVHRRIFWSYSKPTIEERWDGQTLHVTARCRAALLSLGPGCGVDYTIAVPEGVAVEAHTSTGDISVRGVRGGLRLSTSTGDIAVTDATSNLWLRSSTGDINATGVTSSDVEASVSTGDVDLRFTEPPREVAIRASTGDVTVSVPDGEAYRVQTDTGTGDVHIGIRQDSGAERSIVVRTSTGDVAISYA
jgi:hypothetical protein